mgnify:CR=1 FL=1
MATIDLGKIKQVFRGTYNNATAYAVDDLVVFTDGSVTSTYICTTASTGNNPSSGGTAHANWAFVAKGQATSPTTTQGDLIVRGASADERLAIGAAGKALKVNSSANGLEYGTAGRILQVVSVTKSDVFSTSTTGSYVDITGLTINITPIKANSNILVMAVIGCFVSGDAAGIALTTGDGTAIIQGDIASGKDSVSTGAYSGGNSTGEAWYGNNPAPIFKLHDPSYSLGSSITYKCRVKSNSGTTYINRNQSDSGGYALRPASTITLMEVEV